MTRDPMPRSVPLRVLFAGALFALATAATATPVTPPAADSGADTAARGSPLVPPATPVAATRPVAPDVARDLDAALAAARVPGAAIALVTDDAPPRVHAFGRADTASSRAVAADTLFRTGSVSKIVTAIVVMQLVEEGKLSLDDRVADRAPWLRFDNPWESTTPLRVVHLLEHTTGWADLSPREFALDDAALGVRDALALGGVRTSRYPPGRFHAYTSAGYGVVGEIIADIEGKPFAQVAHDRVFAPLGMASATYALPPALATSYLPDGTALAPQRYPLAAAAGLVLDVRDLARLVRFLVDGRADDGRVLLSDASRQRMERSESTLAVQRGLPHGYGLGNAGYVGEHTVFRGHGGAIDAFSAEVRYATACRCGYAVLANGARVPPAALAVLERALATQGPTHGDTAAGAGTHDAGDAHAFTDLASFAGVYQPIAQRNRLLAPIEALTVFVDGTPTADGRFVFEGVARDVDASGRLQRPDRAAPTLALVRDGADVLVLGTTTAWRRVPAWRPPVVAAWGIAFVAAFVASLGLAVAARFRRRPSRLAWATAAALSTVLVLSGLFMIAAAQPSAASIATFGRATALSIAIFVATLLPPLAAIAIAWLAWRRRDAGAVQRSVAWVAASVLAVAAVFLLAAGWVGLRTWAI